MRQNGLERAQENVYALGGNQPADKEQIAGSFNLGHSLENRFGIRIVDDS